MVFLFGIWKKEEEEEEEKSKYLHSEDCSLFLCPQRVTGESTSFLSSSQEHTNSTAETSSLCTYLKVNGLASPHNKHCQTNDQNVPRKTGRGCNCVCIQ